MKLRVVLLMVFVTCGFVQSAPVDTKAPIAASLDDIDIDGNELESLKRKSEVMPPRELKIREKVDDTENGRAFPDSTNSIFEETNLPILCPRDSVNIQDSTSPVNMMDQNLETITSDWYNKKPQTYYQVDYLKNTDSSGVGVHNYDGIQYPFVHPLFAVTSPVPTVSYLPPVYSPRIYDPSLDVPALSRYINDGKSKHVRSVGSREDDLMTELEHAAMMNNIIPTMPVQFFRDAGYPLPQEYQAPITAVFPQIVSGCSIPLLLSCTPKINRGSFEVMPYNAVQISR